MNGLEKINDRIRADERAEIASILAEAGKRAEIAARGYEDRARQMTEDADQKRRIAAEEQLCRARRSAQMEGKQLLLGEKQHCIDEAFARALETLRALPQEEYVALLGRLARQNGSGSEELILSTADRAAFGEAVVHAANSDGGHFVLSSQTRELGGGVVLRQGNVEIDCSFPSQLRALRQTYAGEVAQVLFA